MPNRKFKRQQKHKKIMRIRKEEKAKIKIKEKSIKINYGIMTAYSN